MVVSWARHDGLLGRRHLQPSDESFGKVVVVIAGSTGIGQVIAQVLADPGAAVGPLSRASNQSKKGGMVVPTERLRFLRPPQSGGNRS
jgi:NADPH:quinone reductase-like Zn-dependent oxidoreductase